MNFKQYLDTLRLSAKDAIIDGEEASLSDLKKYLHIKRAVEDDLGALVTEAAAADESRLIFIMGNVGDGKSHLLAKMWEDHPAAMAQFEVYNDATESTSIQVTYLQNLEMVFQPYTDEVLGQGNPAVKTIIAINLGTLTNFLEEASGQFGRLRQWISDNQLIEQQSRVNEQVTDPYFQVINLADYHVFSLEPGGTARCTVLTDILQRITRPVADNPFFQAYHSYYGSHPCAEQCPIKFNFDLLTRAEVQRTLSDVLVGVILADKLIVSVRLLMNWIYDLLVSPELAPMNQEELIERTTLANFGVEYYRHTLPVLLYESVNTSAILRSVREHDPLNVTNEQLELLMIKLGASNTPELYFQQYGLLPADSLLYRVVRLMETRKRLALFVRLHHLLRIQDDLRADDPYYPGFIRNLYWYNAGQTQLLIQIYGQVQQAIYQWNGAPVGGSDHINLRIGNKQSAYKVSQKLDLTAAPIEMTPLSDDLTLQKFTAFLTVGFRIGEEVKRMDIDYRLFKLIRFINEGYRPNRTDKSTHLKFSRFVAELIRYKSQHKTLLIEESTGETRRKFQLDFIPGFNQFQFTSRT